MKRLFLVFLCMFLGVQSLTAQQIFDRQNLQAKQWVDSVFNTLSKKEKIAQLLMVRVNSNKGIAYQDSIAELVRKQKVGGIVTFQGGIKRQITLLNRLQQDAEVPLLVATDAEWGLGMRLDSTNAFPYAMTLGAIQNNALIERMGHLVAQDLKAAGVHMNFAPVADVNNNPANPVIGFRSFGEDKYNVAQKAMAYARGMQKAGVIATAKHFPGHGDTNVDSHYDLPQINHSLQRLDSLEMYPFKEVSRQGIGAVMIAHMNIPSLDTTKNLPSSLSKVVIKEVLKKQIGFQGLVVSDAMDMKGVVKYFPEGEADVRAIEAGIDIIELSEDSKRAIKKIRKAIRQDRISWEEIDEKVRKVLYAKYFAGLNIRKNIKLSGVDAFENREEVKAMKQELSDCALTMLTNKSQLLPLAPHKPIRVMSIAIGGSGLTTIQQEIARRVPTQVFSVSKLATEKELQAIEAQMSNFDYVVISVHETRKTPRPKTDCGIEVLRFIAKHAPQKNVLTAWFANPYALNQVNNIENSNLLFVGYQNSPDMQEAAVKAIFGEIKTQGKLPVSVGDKWHFGEGL